MKDSTQIHPHTKTAKVAKEGENFFILSPINHLPKCETCTSQGALSSLRPSRPLREVSSLLAVAALLLAGCTSTKQYFEQAKANPSLAGGAIRVTTRKFDATVASVSADHRTIALTTKAGTHEYRVSNVVKNLSQVIPGTEVKAKVVDEDALFLGNTPLPAAGPGVSDFKTTIHELDRSYRLITLNYPNGERRDFKVPLGTQLEHVNPGNEVVVRSTVPIVVELEGK